MTTRVQPILIMCILSVVLSGSKQSADPNISGELKQWHKITLTFSGPDLSETGPDNPFLDYRLQATFTNGDQEIIVPGFYAADGNAAETSASTGNKWQVRFRPNTTGKWRYQISFRTGDGIAIDDRTDAGEAVPSLDGKTGSFTVGPSDKTGRDFRAKGRLIHSNERYLKFSGTGEYFLKGGADSPENFLAYYQFDNTYRMGEGENRSGEARTTDQLHQYKPHLKDWNSDDPTWQSGKGKEIIGALNYLASKEMNSVYMLTMNIEGDGKDVWPYTDPTEFTRFDVSKLDQWEIVFDHMEQLGLMIHFVTQETENERLLDDGDTGQHRKLYYRELIARFGHHLAVTWNMGEENGPADFSPDGQSTRQQKEMIQYVKTHNPYPSFVVLHTHAAPQSRYEIMRPLLGFEHLDGPSIQIGDKRSAHSETKAWISMSDSAGKQWVVNIDEIGPASRGVDPDIVENSNQDSVRKYVLWANLMAGGGGAEWYFGYENPHNDLNCEDWRSRDRMWDYTRHALAFFQKHLPFYNMQSNDELTAAKDDYALADDNVYAIYLPTGGTTDLNLGENEKILTIRWYNPRTGDALQSGSVKTIDGSGMQNIGRPPSEENRDWVALIREK